MARRPVSELLLHNFPENGVKFLLHHPDNLHDFLLYLGRHNAALPDPQRFDCAQRTIEPDTLIRTDFSHGITDLLIRLPFRGGDLGSTSIKLYLLFEHLSKHQRVIVPRSLGYAFDVYRLQDRRWLQTHESLQNLLYEVVVPIVFYTGERSWQAPTPFRELVQGGDLFAAFIPPTEPLFLSLPGQPEQELLGHGGALGPVLHVLQQRHAVIEAFHRLLTHAVAAVEGQVPHDRNRLVELLSYLAALLYHFREPGERDDLREELERSVQMSTVRKEVHVMGQTIAEALREEGRREGERKGERKGALKTKQQVLLLMLRHKFGRKVPPALVATIKKTQDLTTLDTWVTNVMDAKKVEEVDIPEKKG